MPKLRTDKEHVEIGGVTFTEYGYQALRNYALGLTNQESAKLLNTTESAVAMQVHRSCAAISIPRRSAAAAGWLMANGEMHPTDLYQRYGLVPKGRE